MIVVAVGSATVAELPALFAEVGSFRRHPTTAQDNVAALVATALCFIPLTVVSGCGSERQRACG